jgi:hypothetical protein
LEEKNQTNNNEEDISFKPKHQEDINSRVDNELLRIRDRIKLVDDIKKNPPKPGVLNIDIPDGTYEIDLNTLLAAQITDCPATIIPMLIDHGVRTAVDIKETYKPEKRMLDFSYWWLIVLIIGLVAIVMIANMIFGIF